MIVYVDVGTAAQNMLNMAHALGVGSCPVTSFSQSGVAGVLGLPGNLSVELLIMLSGEAVLVEDDGESVLRAGDVAAWSRGTANGHCLQNRSEAACAFVAISAGDSESDSGDYPDIDMRFGPGGFTHKDGTPYPPKG